MAGSLELVLAIAAGSIASLLFSISAVMFCYFKLIHSRATAAISNPTDEEDAEKAPDAKQGLIHRVDDVVHHSVRRYDQHEIDAVVAGLAPSDIIGEGGYSAVYRSRLRVSRGTPSSVDAALKLYVAGGGRAFQRELDVLLHIQHPRIVRLLGYSDDAGALVLELAPNGNLHRRLHGGGDSATATSSLTWPQRMRIAHEVARALEYLHEEEEERRPAVVHGDVTSANVLLDGRMDPKLCDFGSAVSGFSAAVRRPAGPMVGSPGYTDPHFLRTGVASKKSDVYSFGVLLLELVTGQRAVATEADGEGEVKLKAAVEALMGEGRGVAELVDEKLVTAGGFDKEEAEDVVAIAGRCVDEQPSARPTMTELRQMLRAALRSSISVVDVDEGSEDKG